MREPIGVGINGMGRIGLLTYRILEQYVQKGDIKIIAVNDVAADPEQIAYKIRRDSVHKFNGKVEHDASHLIVNGNRIEVVSERYPSDLKWGDKGVQIVFDATGVFRTARGGPRGAGYMTHIDQGAEYVVISAPGRDDVAKTVVLGVNFDPAYLRDHQAISNASCTTNCFAPVVKVLDENFGVEGGHMITVHGYTADQKPVDTYHKDFRRGRAAAANIVPTTTGAAKAIGVIFPHLQGKIGAFCYRVPVPDGSIIDFLADLKREATPEDVNAAMKAASEGSLEGILEFSDDHLVSSDIIGNPHSAVFDSLLTFQGSNGRQVKVCSWYDNEWAYSTRSAELILEIAKFMQQRDQ